MKEAKAYFSENKHEYVKRLFFTLSVYVNNNFMTLLTYEVMHEKCPNTQFFPVRIFLYSVRIQENMDQKKLRIWTVFTQ